jgi:hypothetical protein
MNPPRDLNRVRLRDAERPGVRYITIHEGERLSLLAATAYRDGWVLKEVNAEGVTVAAYQKGPRT